MWRKFVFVLIILLLAFPLSIPNQAQCLDIDQDRICDNVDPCPNDRANTCDDDSDGDGTVDSADQCPNERGVSSNNGCPAPDRDGDGTEDSQDRCPETAHHGTLVAPKVKAALSPKPLLMAMGMERLILKTSAPISAA